MVFQQFNLFPHLTALENITLAPRVVEKVPEEEAQEIALKLLTRVGLGDRGQSYPHQLSGGQQQRVSIARAIGHGPKIIFADEPTANLDSETSRSVLDTFLELNKEGQTIVMVTHEPEYAELADRIIILADGRIIQDKMNRS
jgi:ABC-type polar amino acid transport system ATPase subunit